jgi:hypothetical protein
MASDAFTGDEDRPDLLRLLKTWAGTLTPSAEVRDQLVRATIETAALEPHLLESPINEAFLRIMREMAREFLVPDLE